MLCQIVIGTGSAAFAVRQSSYATKLLGRGGIPLHVCDDCHVTVVLPSIMWRPGEFIWHTRPDGSIIARNIWVVNRHWRRNLNLRRRQKCHQPPRKMLS